MTSTGTMCPIAFALGTVAAWLALGACGNRLSAPAAAPAARGLPPYRCRRHQPNGCGVVGDARCTERIILPLGLPDLPFHLREDVRWVFDYLRMTKTLARLPLPEKSQENKFTVRANPTRL